MVRTLLVRGMLAGLLAGLLMFGFGRLLGEPSVERAIAFETAMDAARHADHGDAAAGEEEEVVSRPVQAGAGLLTAVVVYGAAFGGLFALVFSAVHGRMAALSPRATAALLAGVGFVALYLVPNLKYPANPPAVGEADTIGHRTALYFIMLAISLLAAIAASASRRRLAERLGGWNATLAAGAAYLVAVVLAGILLPVVNEVPDNFPAVLLWQFRLASAGLQLLMWTVLGLAFGAMAERVLSTGNARMVATNGRLGFRT